MPGVLYSSYFVTGDTKNSTDCKTVKITNKPDRTECTKLRSIRYVTKNKDGTYTDTGKVEYIDDKEFIEKIRKIKIINCMTVKII